MRHKQYYWPSTNVLVTRFLLADGIAEMEDFMPVGLALRLARVSSHLPPHSLRSAERCALQSVAARPSIMDDRHTTRGSRPTGRHSESGSLPWLFQLPCRSRMTGRVEFPPNSFSRKENHRFSFLGMTVSRAPSPHPPSEKDAEKLLRGTVKFWQSWLSACTYHGRWRDQVHRSALALKLLTFEPTGAIVAAPTTSLPEVIGGTRNWDYRYTWMRDAAFTVYAFLRIGFRDEAAAFISWIEDYAAKHARPGESGAVVFTLQGENHLPEQVLDHWEGYRGSGPVRIGNAAVSQYQGDIYGELMDALYLSNKYVSPTSYDAWVKIRKRLDWICDNWQLPDAGIWEMRNRQEHFVYSKVMNWVALDRGIRLAEKRALPADRG